MARVLGAVCAALWSGCGAAPREEPRPNLILISIDTLRADRLDAYGYERKTSPTLSALAARGVLFETVIAESHWTLPSHMTLFTGLQPSFHGVTRRQHKLGPEVPTLAEILARNGYRNFAATGGALLDPDYGFGRGFEEYWTGVDLRTALDHVISGLRKLPREERFFWFVHTYEVHCPYDPPSVYAQMFNTSPRADHLGERDRRCYGDLFADRVGPDTRPALTPGQARFLSNLYDGSIRYADELLRAFFERLAVDRRVDDTLIVVVSDHGEEFLEHGQIGHRSTVYIEALRVPWIMAGPGLEPGVVAEPAGLADVMPTLLDLLDVDAPVVQGASLLSFIAAPPRPSQRSLFSESEQLGLYSLVRGDQHLIRREQTSEYLLFDWRADPLETLNLIGEAPAREAELRGLLDSQIERLALARGGPDEQPTRELDERLLERLRALGYLDD